MKRILLIAALALFNSIFTETRAQSRPPSNESTTNQKANKRPPKTATETPPVNVVVDDDPNTTNIERIVENPTEASGGGEEVIKIDTKLVTIPVKVLDRNNRFITGLTQDKFEVFEDKMPQIITYFSNEQQPFTVALILDMSYSSKFKTNEIQQAAISFLDQLRAPDRVIVISFDEEVHVLSQPTSDRQVLQRAIRSTKVASGTSLYEAVDMAINEKLKKIGGRKAVVLFTDGVDTSSRRANDLDNLRAALEFDALIYPIQYDTFSEVQRMKNQPIVVPPTVPSPIPSKNKSPFPFPLPTSTGSIGTPSSKGTSAEDYRRANEYLKEMANRTGGTLYQASTAADLTRAFAAIAAELREYYSLGYYPPDEAKEGKRRKIKVRVKQNGAAVKARDGYVIEKKDER